MDMDFATSCPLVRPVLPHIRLLFVRSRFRSTLPSDGPSRFRPCASLVLHLHQVAQGTFTPRLLDMPSTQDAARRFRRWPSAMPDRCSARHRKTFRPGHGVIAVGVNLLAACRQQENPMEPQHYVGLDVPQELTSVCVIDQQGTVIWRGICVTDPDTITKTIRQYATHGVRAGPETGLLSNFLTRSLRARQVPIVCLDARHAKAALRVQINKTDANDAHGLAQVVRTGWFREIAVKSMDAQSLRLCWLRARNWSRNARRPPIRCAAC